MYFELPYGLIKIQTTNKNSQQYYTTKHLIRDMLYNTPNCDVRAGEFSRYLWGVHDRSTRSRTELAWEIQQLTDWSTAGEQDKPV